MPLDPELEAILNPPKPPSLDREIRLMRHAIRYAHRQINQGNLDFHSGALLLTHLANALARLHLAAHRITPPEERDPFNPLRRKFDRMLIELGYGPKEAKPPQPPPSPEDDTHE